MVGTVAAWLLAKNLVGSTAAARGAARLTLAIAGLVVLALALAAAVWLLRRDAVEEFQGAQRAEKLDQALKGERRANRGAAERMVAREAASEMTHAQLETIHAEDPETARAPASAGSRAVAERLRKH